MDFLEALVFALRDTLDPWLLSVMVPFADVVVGVVVGFAVVLALRGPFQPGPPLLPPEASFFFGLLLLVCALVLLVVDPSAGCAGLSCAALADWGMRGTVTIPVTAARESTTLRNFITPPFSTSNVSLCRHRPMRFHSLQIPGAIPSHGQPLSPLRGLCFVVLKSELVALAHHPKHGLGFRLQDDVLRQVLRACVHLDLVTARCERFG